MSEPDISVSNANELLQLPLRDVVVYPHMVTPVFVGRVRSIEALVRAMGSDKQVLLVAQRNPSVDDPKAEDVYSIGTIASILQLLKLPDGTVKVLVEGVERANIEAIDDLDTFFRARIVPMTEEELSGKEAD